MFGLGDGAGGLQVISVFSSIACGLWGSFYTTALEELASKLSWNWKLLPQMLNKDACLRHSLLTVRCKGRMK
jgi:hypothetical protein